MEYKLRLFMLHDNTVTGLERIPLLTVPGEANPVPLKNDRDSFYIRYDKSRALDTKQTSANIQVNILGKLIPLFAFVWHEQLAVSCYQASLSETSKYCV